MRYISGMQALNLPCELDTCGDWHRSGMDWDTPFILDSDHSIFGEYGIEHNKPIPDNQGLYSVANHIRACLDLLALGFYDLAQGMKEDFICTDKYDSEIFEKVLMMRKLRNWLKINDFMEQEYRLEWINFREDRDDSKKSRKPKRDYPSIFEILAR